MQIILFILLLSLSACTSPNKTPENCIQKKMTLDVGSGATKYYLARVNSCERRVIQVVENNSFPYPFKQHLIESKDNKFSQEFQNAFRKKIGTLLLRLQPQEIVGAATSAFRTSKNGATFAQGLERDFTMKLTVIDQKQEGWLGLNAVRGKLSLDEEFLYWDVGGGSMQIIHYDKDRNPIFEGKIGSSSFSEMILQKIFQGKRKSPNPIGRKNVSAVVQLAEDFARKSLPRHFLNLNSRIKVFGVGGVHQYSVLGRNSKGRNSEGRDSKEDQVGFTQQDLQTWLEGKSEFTDEQLESPYAMTDVSNMALILGFMKALNVQAVQVVPGVNMAYGLLFAWH